MCLPGLRRFCLCPFLWVLVGLLPAFGEKPNIVLLFSDDAGYADFGFQDGADPKLASLTPRITELAREGVRFSNAYVSGAVCSPSRAGLVTGRYQERFGHELNIPPGYMKGGLPLTEKFIGDRLKPLGYTSALIGKWHLGYPKEYQPNQRGFDYFYGCLQGARSYYPYEKAPPHQVFLENTTPTPEGGYTTDRIGDKASEFVSKHKANPFFLFVSFTAPHGPLQPRKGEKLPGFKSSKRSKYAGLVKALDENVGKILDAIDKAGIKGKTLVVFTNDNGGQTMIGANNGALRGRKGQLWEGGIRVPMAMRWPGRIKPGGLIEDPVITLDFLPTFLAAAGGNVDPKWKLDGLNLLPRLTGTAESLPQRRLFWRRAGSGSQMAIREGNWKLIAEGSRVNSRPLLFDLEKDTGEQSDLSRAHPEVVERLETALESWEKELVEPLWTSSAKRKRNQKEKP